MSQEHPFAPYVRILGKGKQGSRSLNREEARDAMGMILDDQVEPEQLGAFMMLLRVKEEEPQELAGFAEAVRERYSAPQDLTADLDWSCYSGKKRRHPWFLLVALCLAENGYRIFMHGARGHTPSRLYSEDMLSMFGLTTCDDWRQVAEQLQQRNFAYMSIDQLCAPLGEIIQLRSIMGLRSPVHTLCRILNPLDSECSIAGVFHPPYGPMRQKAAQILGMQRNLIIKGDGGEAEAKPDGESTLQWIIAGEASEEEWPRIVERRFLNEKALDPAALIKLWRGESDHPYGEKAIVSTLALALKLLRGGDDSDTQRLHQAEQMWQQRNRSAY
ncbi:glycosyl transferase family protein [Marinobacterium jannaschii]|uniref:glycosyl transferase family protein n=1 Tax=Marinobacterium jannaschii TaxID=64970 RepID=UPI0004884CDC|nr:glycosyl transferase family protein [Marinobacterium jannaschii]